MLLSSRISFTLVCLSSSSYLDYPHPSSAFQALRISITRIPHLLFKLFVSRLPASLICFSSSSYPDYPHPSSAFQALRIPITHIPHLLFKLFVSRLPASLICFSSSSYPDYSHLVSALQKQKRRPKSPFSKAYVWLSLLRERGMITSCRPYHPYRPCHPYQALQGQNLVACQ